MLRRSLSALAAVLVLGACSPWEVAWWHERAAEAAALGRPCPMAAAGIIVNNLPEEFYEVARRESGCDPEAINADSGALGLVQIMPFWLEHLCSLGIACSAEELLRADVNLAAAGVIYREQGPSAWSQTWP